MNDPAFPDASSPGALIHLAMAKRGWQQRDLAFVLGMSEQAVSKLLNDQRPISAELAKRLAGVLDIMAWRIMVLQNEWKAKRELERAPDPPDEDMRKARVAGVYPIRDMVKRGWLVYGRGGGAPPLEDQLCRFFGVASLDEIPHFDHAAKRSVYGEILPAQLAWLFRARQMAAKMVVAKYSEAAGRSVIAKMDSLLWAVEEARKVPRIMAEAGIRLVFVESLPGAKIDGACFWLTERAPVIAMSLRFDRIDNFWFVLRHEMEHVLRRHGGGAVVLDAELEGARAGTGGDLPDQEQEANEAAAAFCVPPKSLQQFVARKAPTFAERDILAFSQAIKVHPGIVAGQIQRKTGRYDRFRQHQVKIRAIVSTGAMVDGWGDVAPIDG